MSKRKHAAVDGPEAAPAAVFTFDPSQHDAIEWIMGGHTLFITGGAGSGKSTLIKEAVSRLRAAGANVKITAPSGVAAVNIQGTTLHKFMGMGLAKESLSELKSIISSRPQLKSSLAKNYLGTDVLIIDEISMVSPDIFGKLDGLLRWIRADEVPFGGLQVVFVGDFFQLPPVISNASEAGGPEFVFELPLWTQTVQKVVVLKKIYRQEDEGFVATLNRLRYGKPNAADIELLASRVVGDKAIKTVDGIIPTLLESHRADVDRINRERLRELMKGGESSERSEASTFTGRTRYADNKMLPKKVKACHASQVAAMKAALVKNCMVDNEVVLAVGAQVILLTNINVDAGLVNGSRGVITEIVGDGVWVKFLHATEPVLIGVGSWKTRHEEGDGYVVYEQIPLKLAWAITIHKAQGMSVDFMYVPISKNIFAPGQAYVALSRVTSLEGLHLSAFDPSVIVPHEKVLQFYENGCKTRSGLPVDRPVFGWDM